MVNKSNIALIIIGGFLSAQFLVLKSLLFFTPLHHWHNNRHLALDGSLGFTSLVGVALILLGIYNIYKENKVKKSE